MDSASRSLYTEQPGLRPPCRRGLSQGALSSEWQSGTRGTELSDWLCGKRSFVELCGALLKGLRGALWQALLCGPLWQMHEGY